MSIGFARQEKRFKVFPRRPRTERVQIAIAAASLFAAVAFVPLRNFTVRRTFLIHRQKSFARGVVILMLFYEN